MDKTVEELENLVGTLQEANIQLKADLWALRQQSGDNPLAALFDWLSEDPLHMVYAVCIGVMLSVAVHTHINLWLERRRS